MPREKVPSTHCIRGWADSRAGLDVVGSQEHINKLSVSINGGEFLNYPNDY